ncbi:hypothetical protein [Streptomyces sp. NPDC059874]|uniref:hypothetical protein n=1 Tax=Streptomyces sp. NPDC059874 TaxID=3346983 RepID=UPI003652B7E0
MNNAKRMFAAIAIAGAALSVAAGAHAADPVPVTDRSRLNANDALVVEAIHTDVWKSGFDGGNATTGSVDGF